MVKIFLWSKIFFQREKLVYSSGIVYKIEVLRAPWVGIEFVSYFALFPKIDFSDQFEANAIWITSLLIIHIIPGSYTTCTRTEW